MCIATTCRQLWWLKHDSYMDVSGECEGLAQLRRLLDGAAPSGRNWGGELLRAGLPLAGHGLPVAPAHACRGAPQWPTDMLCILSLLLRLLALQVFGNCCTGIFSQLKYRTPTFC